MARQRDYRAEYRRRLERAKQRGLSAAQATGHAKRAKVESVKELERQGRIPKLPPKRKRPPRRVETEAGELITTTSRPYVVQQLRRAKREGKRVVIYVELNLPKTGWRTVILDGREKTENYSGSGDEGEVGARIRMVITDDPAVLGPSGGLDPQEVLDAIEEAGGDVDGALWNLWSGDL